MEQEETLGLSQAMVIISLIVLFGLLGIIIVMFVRRILYGG